MKKIFLSAIFIAGAAVSAFCQEPDIRPIEDKNVPQTGTPRAGSASQGLYDEIAHMDSVLFDAFNTQKLDKLRTIFAEDLEFYHDNQGLVLYAEAIDSFKKLFEQNNGLKRELVKGSLEVYPIKDYGAIQVGLHKFCHLENGKQDCGTFKFVHIWRKKAGEWKISRVVSYGH